MMTASESMAMATMSRHPGGILPGATLSVQQAAVSPLERLGMSVRHLHEVLGNLQTTLYIASGQLGGPDCPPPESGTNGPVPVMRPLEAIGNGIDNAAKFAEHLDRLARNVLREVVNMPD